MYNPKYKKKPYEGFENDKSSHTVFDRRSVTWANKKNPTSKNDISMDLEINHMPLFDFFFKEYKKI